MLSKSALEAAICSIRNQIVTDGMFIADAKTLQISKFDCAYRATHREELTNLLISNGCSEVKWLFLEETVFYQPIVVAKK